MNPAAEVVVRNVVWMRHERMLRFEDRDQGVRVCNSIVWVLVIEWIRRVVVEVIRMPVLHDQRATLGDVVQESTGVAP